MPAADPAPEPAPSPRSLRPSLLAPRRLVPLRAALVAMASFSAAGFLAGRLTADDRPVHSIVVDMPMKPATLEPVAPEPARPQPEPATPAPEPAAEPPADSAACAWKHSEGTPPAEWTMSEEHFGPIDRCMTSIDLADLKRMLPGYDVAAGQEPDFPHGPQLRVTKRGRPVLTIWPPADDGPGLRVSIHSAAFQTPWRVRAGDSIGTLVAHHRGIQCIYGRADGHEVLWCQRVITADGWRDHLRYMIDLRPLGEDRSLVLGEIDVSKIAHLRIASIDWQPAAKE